MMRKTDIDYLEGLKLLYKPNSVDRKALFLVASDGEGRVNVMPFGSWFILPGEPDGWSFYIHIFKKNFSYELLQKNGQFTVNLPPEGMEDTIKYYGSVSGRDHDKIKERGLTVTASRIVVPPVIAECTVHLECEVRRSDPFLMTFPGQDKEPREMMLFEAQILAVYADEEIVRKTGD